MSGWREDQLQALLTMRNERQLMEEITAIARDLGFDFCAYGMRMPVPLSEPKIAMFNNYPAAWQTQYQAQRYVEIDPTVHHCTQSLRPIVWSDEVFATVPQFWEEARSFGLKVGWAQSSYDANAVAGMLTLARTEEPLTESELHAKRLMMAWLTQVTHLGMSQCLTPRLLQKSEIRLTERERAVLRWTGDGKTVSDCKIRPHLTAVLILSDRHSEFI